MRILGWWIDEDGSVSSKEGLLEQLLDFPAGHPYAKWTGIHWRLVEIADAGVAVPRARLDDPCAADALEIVECARGANGRFAGRSWASSRAP